MKEYIIAGHNDIKGSPLPQLYEQFGCDPAIFIEYAWIRLIADLFVTGIVTNVEHLELELLEGSQTLQINLVATRHGEDVILNGTCRLTR